MLGLVALLLVLLEPELALLYHKFYAIFNPWNATGLSMPGTAHIFKNFQTCFLCQFCLLTVFYWVYVGHICCFEKKSLTRTVLCANYKFPVLRCPFISLKFSLSISLAGTSARRSAFAVTPVRRLQDLGHDQGSLFLAQSAPRIQQHQVQGLAALNARSSFWHFSFHFAKNDKDSRSHVDFFTLAAAPARMVHIYAV